MAATGADILLGNTYHLMLRPTAERIARLGGLHRFMNWSGPILTDSGGFQVMSLAELRKLTEEGGDLFRSHIDGSRHMLSPERSMEIQRLLGSDIVMCFDECPALPASDEEVARATPAVDAMGGTVEGGLRRPARPCAFRHPAGRRDAGASRRKRREASRDRLRRLRGRSLAVGEGQEAMFGVLDYAPDMLPRDRPRYLMGVGKPDDIVGGRRARAST